MVEPKTRYYRDIEVKMSDAQIVIANYDQEKIKEIVVFEDGEIKVLFWKGCSEKIIVTFGDLVSLADGTKYFADTPLKKLGLSTFRLYGQERKLVSKAKHSLGIKKSISNFGAF